MPSHEKTLRTIALTYGHDAKLHELNEQANTAAIERNRQAACLAGAEALRFVDILAAQHLDSETPDFLEIGDAERADAWEGIIQKARSLMGRLK